MHNTPLTMRAAVLALTVQAGCSFAFTSSPPPPCTSSAVAPVADTAVATIAAIAAIYFATEGEGLETAASGGLAVGFGAGAVTGYRRVGRCREAR